MKTKLYSEIVKMDVDTPTAEKAGKIKDVLGNKSEKYWEGKEVEIKSGMIKRKKNYFEVDDLRDLGEERIELNRGIEDGSDNYSGTVDISLHQTKGKKVMMDEEEVGSVYDFEIQLDTKPWKVWNILVKPTGISPTKRRMRISIDDIEEVKQDEVILCEDYEMSEK